MNLTGIDNLSTNYATPRVSRIGGGEAVLLECIGDLDRDAYKSLVSLCDRVLADDTARVAILVLNCQCAQWPIVAAVRASRSLQRLAKAKLLIGFVDGAALGASLLLACSCNFVYARADSRLGLIGACDDDATAALEVEIGEARPLAQKSLGELHDAVISGEGAESKAYRLVDGLCPSPEALLAKLFRRDASGNNVLRIREANSSYVIFQP